MFAGPNQAVPLEVVMALPDALYVDPNGART